jgi:hypothetical protein
MDDPTPSFFVRILPPLVLVLPIVRGDTLLWWTQWMGKSLDCSTSTDDGVIYPSVYGLSK